jgi:hypothetical protein
MAKMGLKKAILFVLCFVLFSSCSVQPKPPTVIMRGEAAYDEQASPGVARRLAVEDAERKAVQQSARIQSNTQQSMDRVYTTTQTDPQQNLGQTKVIAQRKNNDSLSLTTEVELAPRSSCASSSYKKKIAVATFNLLHLEHVPDIAEVSSGFAVLLARRLHESQSFMIRDIEKTNVFDQSPHLAPRIDELQDNYKIIDLADRVDAQFVVAGVIRDFHFHKSGVADVLSSLTEYLIDIPPYERTFRVEMFIYDGLTGAMIDRREYEKKALGKVYFSSPTHLDSEEFSSSSIGEAVTQILMAQVHDIEAKLKCLPFMERILKVDHEHVYFNAGTLQNIRVGDSFVVYQEVDKALPGVYYQNSHLRGYTEKAKAVLTVQQVQPLFSIGILDVKNAGQIFPTDIVRSW